MDLLAFLDLEITTDDVESVLGQKIKISYNKKIIKSRYVKKAFTRQTSQYYNQKKCPKKFAFITFGSKYPVTRNSFNLSKKSNLNEAAKKLYMYFRIIKNKGYKKIYVTRIPKRGIGKAINDRLNRAAK